MTSPKRQRPTPLTRRRFLTMGGVSAVWVATGCRTDGSTAPPPVSTTLPPVATTVAGLETTTTTAASGSTGRPVLVVVQLLGGNDALNTLVPTAGAYRDARPALAVDEAELLAIDASYALHPALAPLADLYASGDLAFVAGVGFEGQSRSHFQSQDVWWRAADDPSMAGWLARWIDHSGIDQPDSPLEAIALGAGPVALVGSGMPAVNDPASFTVEAPGPMNDDEFRQYLEAMAQPGPDDPALLAMARGSLPDMLAVSLALDEARAANDEPAADGRQQGRGAALGPQLDVAASLIASRPELQVVTVGTGGFDTHANQGAQHPALLEGVASALAGFWDQLDPADRDRVVVMTTSEFGRRVIENGSGGTDHGRAGMQMVLGGSVAGGQTVGGYDLDNLDNGDLPITVPSLDLYGDALRHLGGPVAEVLGADPPATGLFA